MPRCVRFVVVAVAVVLCTSFAIDLLGFVSIRKQITNRHVQLSQSFSLLNYCIFIDCLLVGCDVVVVVFIAHLVALFNSMLCSISFCCLPLSFHIFSTKFDYFMVNASAIWFYLCRLSLSLSFFLIFDVASNGRCVKIIHSQSSQCSCATVWYAFFLVFFPLHYPICVLNVIRL